MFKRNTLDEETELLIKKEDGSYGYDENQTRQSSRLAWSEASFFRWWHVLCWSWLNPIIALGRQRTLTDHDLDDLTPEHRCSTLLDSLKQHDWTSNSTWKILFRVFGKRCFCVGLLLLPRMVVRIIQALVLRQIVQLIGASTVSASSGSVGYIYVACLSICMVVQLIIHHQFMFRSARISVTIRTALSSIIYKRLLSTHQGAFQQTTAAQTINLVAHDTAKFEEFTTLMHYIWQAPFEALVIFFLLWWMIGPLPVCVGYIVLLLLIPLQVVMSRLFGRYSMATREFADKRVHAFNELIHGYHVVKLYNWEEPMQERVLRLRQCEFDSIRRAARLRATNTGLFFASVPLMALGTFGSAWLMGSPLTVADIFTTLMFFGNVRVPLTQFLPQAIEKLSELRTSIKRIDDFMQLAQVKVVNDCSEQAEPHQAKGSIVMRNASFSWNEADVSLSSLNIEIDCETFVGIVGPVGSGKTSLLSAIIGELTLTSGTMDVHGSSLSYAAQSPWILADTLRANILLGKSFDESRYWTTVRACCLDIDINAMGANADLTVIGDRGVTLSGGQKARVSLARALYADADVYLLDDPLAAVDPTVAKLIYDRCIGPQSLLQKKTRLLVTHQLQYLTDSNQTIILSQGHIRAQGPFASLPVQHVEIDTTDRGGPSTDKPIIHSMLDIKSAASPTKSIIDEEISSSDAASASTWRSLFIVPPWGWCGFSLLIMLLVIGEVLYEGINYWLSIWTRLFHADQRHRLATFYFYVFLTVLTMIVAVLRTNFFFHLFLNGSNRLHTRMFNGLLYTSMSFFESNPAGRILNRASKDQQVVDEQLPVILFDAIQSFLMIAGAFVIVGLSQPAVLLLLVPLAPSAWILSHFCLQTNRQLKRLESVSRSPIYSLFSSSSSGLSTIRAFKALNAFLRLFETKIDANMRAYTTMIATTSWLGFWIDLLVAVVVCFAALISIVLRNTMDPGAAALSLMYSINLTTRFQWGIQQLTESFVLMTSAERIDEYGQLPREEDDNSQRRLIRTSEEWPEQGSIEFRNYYLRYRPHLDATLNDINVHIEPRQKIGIMGRTGKFCSST